MVNLKTAKGAMGLAALVSTIWVGAWQMDNRYAQADAVDRELFHIYREIGDLTGLYIESELRALRRQLFELRVENQRRQLTPLEIQRMEELRREIARLERKIARMRDRRR